MNKCLAIVLGLFAVGSKADCQLTDAQKSVVIEKLQTVIERETTERVTYRLSPGFVKNGSLLDIELQHDWKLDGYTGKCWVMLTPESRIPGQGILDGDRGVYIDMKTLEPGAVFWFSY